MVKECFFGCCFFGCCFVGCGFVGSCFLGCGFVGSCFLGSGFLGSCFLGSCFLGCYFIGSGFLGSGRVVSGGVIDNLKLTNFRAGGTEDLLLVLQNGALIAALTVLLFVLRHKLEFRIVLDPLGLIVLIGNKSLFASLGGLQVTATSCFG